MDKFIHSIGMNDQSGNTWYSTTSRAVFSYHKTWFFVMVLSSNNDFSTVGSM